MTITPQMQLIVDRIADALRRIEHGQRLSRVEIDNFCNRVHLLRWHLTTNPAYLKTSKDDQTAQDERFIPFESDQPPGR